MKQIKFYAMMMAVAAVTFLASCDGGDGDEIKPDPAVNWKTTAGYTSTSTSVEVDSTVKAGILINHDRKIKNVKFQVTVAGSPFTVLDTAVNDKVVDIDLIRQVIATPGSEIWTVIATDEDDLTGTATFTLTVTGQDQNLIAYEGNSAGTIDIYRLQSSEPKSALNLEDMIIYSAANPDDDVKDIYDNTVGSAALYTPKWASKTGLEFVKVTGSLDYATATKYSEIVNYYNSKSPVAETSLLSVGDQYVAKGSSRNRYFLLLIDAIEDGTGVNNDYVTVKIKTIDITM